MKSPAETFQSIRGKIRREWRIAFLSCFFTGLLVHMPILLSDIPNHDGLDSMYFDQNMITSGRWFLSIACGFSSYYTIPWVIGILGLVFLSLGAAALCELLEVRKAWAAGLCSSLLAVFPALASTFAYVYTLDGYMLALLLAILAVLFTKRYRRGFLPGAVCLAFSMGIYQGYLSFVMILSVFSVLKLLVSDTESCGYGLSRTGKPGGTGRSGGTGKPGEPGRSGGTGKPDETGSSGGTGKPDKTGRSGEACKTSETGKTEGQYACGKTPAEKNTAAMLEKIREMLHYLYMGILGAALYYGILQLLLRVQGKELDTYQGINGMASGTAAGSGLLSAVAGMYQDFFRFSLKGNVLFQNVFSLAAWVFLFAAAAVTFILWSRRRKYWKNPFLLVIMVAAVLVLPLVTNIVLLVSPEVNYHLLMRYQWVLYAIGAVALAAKDTDRSVTGTGRCAEAVSGKRSAEPGGAGHAASAEGEGYGTVKQKENSARPAASAEGEGYGTVKQKENSNVSRGMAAALEWLALLSASVLVFCYCITDNIAYSNLEKRYEKTYAYCVRLLDRIEQTPGYYPGIPIAMVGVVAEEQYPVTDLTLPVTSNMIGMNGDVLLYRGDNYRLFIRNYLGATLNILPAEAMAEMYYSEEYTAMDSFPGEDSIRVIDGIMYIKTENAAR